MATTSYFVFFSLSLTLIPYAFHPLTITQMFLNNKILRHACEAKIELEAAVAQRLVDEGRRELDAKRSMVRHVSHEIRYVHVKMMRYDAMRYDVGLPSPWVSLFLTSLFRASLVLVLPCPGR